MSPSPHSRSSPSEKPTAIRRGGREESEKFEMTDQHLPNLTEWLEMVAVELDLPADVVAPGPILDMTKDVAHGIVRPGAPTSSYLVGVALGLHLAAQSEAGEDAVPAEDQLKELSEQVRDLVARTRREAGAEPEAKD